MILKKVNQKFIIMNLIPSEFEEQGDMEALERAYREVESKKKR